MSRWILILGGIIDILFGAALLLYPVSTISFLLILFGIYAVLQGIALMVTAFSGDETGAKWWLGAGGALGILAGIVAIFYQQAAFLILVYFVVFRAMIIGISELAASIRFRKVIKGEFLLGLAGVLNILFGLFVLFYPFSGAAIFILILGWYSIIVGLVLIVRGFLIKADQV